jgi:hypothetical protein
VKSYRVLVAVAVAALGVTLSACSPNEAGSAALVGSERITSTELDDAIRAYKRDLAAKKVNESQLNLPSSMPQTVLYRMASSMQFAEYGEQKGITVSEGEVDQFIQAQGGQPQIDQALLASGIPLSQGRDTIRALLIQQKLLGSSPPQDQQAQQAAQQKVIAEADKAVPITFSPRYGRFNPAAGFEGDPRFGAVPTSAPAAPPAPQ